MRLDKQVRAAIDGLELPFNAIGLDPFGISKRHMRVLLTASAALYRWYFSVETRGIEHVPTRGRAMLVGNHSGGIPIDAIMVITSCLLEMSPPRLAQGMVDKFVSHWPLIGKWASRAGQFTGLPENAERLLHEERLLLVFPEGARGTAKLFRSRNSLVDFGSGFIRLAQKTQAPIIPFVVLGASEAFPTVANAYKLGRAVGLPYIPVPAYGFPLVLPAKVEIEYGPPLRFPGTGNEDDEVVRSHVEEVKGILAGMLEAGARRRRGGALLAERVAERAAP
jgi:1-acyl-sn-glycerol-3-phosphate acyltransferase